ncbi:MAG: DUF885 family protein [Lachnospiraceae bacterium]|nr:DUF885 family protein [Lachnospiraceae bacterium]
MPRFLSKLSRSRKICLGFLLLFMISFTAAAFRFRIFLPETRRFEQFTEDVFRSELAGNSLSLHYTVADPSSYKLDQCEVTLGKSDPDSRKRYYAAAENYLTTLQGFAYNKLTETQKLTYDIFEDYLQTELDAASLMLYDEPLGPTLGVQAQLPILFAEFPFRTKGDIEDYLTLLSQVPDYFRSILSFENARSANGLFMSDDCAQEVIAQCQKFIEAPESNYLIGIFNDKIDAVTNLTADEKISYKNRNSQLLLSSVVPAYQELIDGLSKLLGTGTNPMGLYYYPSGTNYYEYLVKSNVGDDRPIEEIEEAVKKQMVTDYAAIQKLLTTYYGTSSGPALSNGAPSDTTQSGNTSSSTPQSGDAPSLTSQSGDASSGTAQPDNASSANTQSGSASSDGTQSGTTAPSQPASSGSVLSGSELSEAAWTVETLAPAARSDPAAILNELRQKITQDFPVLPNVSCQIKYVHDSLQEYLSPAFYLTPAIDDYKNNVIYINPASNYNALELYTTLAHEGYPGHLYQSVYFTAGSPDLLRSILNYDGYVEGWATYVEMYSYSLWEDDPQLAELSQHNRSFMLGLASLLDIGIHYRGYSMEEVAAFLQKLGFQSSTADSLYRSILEAPANYLQYYVGYLNFCDLRDYAKEKMGNQFTLKKYHTMILDAGPAPFSILRTCLENAL